MVPAHKVCPYLSHHVAAFPRDKPRPWPVISKYHISKYNFIAIKNQPSDLQFFKRLMLAKFGDLDLWSVRHTKPEPKTEKEPKPQP